MIFARLGNSVLLLNRGGKIIKFHLKKTDLDFKELSNAGNLNVAALRGVRGNPFCSCANGVNSSWIRIAVSPLQRVQLCVTVNRRGLRNATPWQTRFVLLLKPNGHIWRLQFRVRLVTLSSHFSLQKLLCFSSSRDEARTDRTSLAAS